MGGRKQILGAIALLLLLAAYWQESRETGSSTPEPPRVQPQHDARPILQERASIQRIDSGITRKKSNLVLFSFEEVIAERASKEWMTVVVRVVKTLPDDNDGSRHQRFLVEGNDGNTVLVAHNIDLATPIPLHRRDVIEIRGRYEWNEKGGVLHWTHHDPSGRLEGGWIRHADTKYR